MRKQIACILILILSFGIILPMSEYTWGDLPKDQVNAQLITEYVTQAILDHEANPDAHLGAGQSLAEHRENPIIDHPAQSVVPDKLFGGDLVIKTLFDTLDNWNVIGDSYVDGWNGLNLPVEYGTTNTSKISGSMFANGEIFLAVSDIYFETQGIWSGSNSHVNAWFGFLSTYTTANNGFGFQVRNGVLYAQINFHTTTHEQSLGSVDIGQSHFYSAKYVYADQKVYFYVDAVLVATLDANPGVYWDDDRVPQFGVTLTQSNDGSFYFQYLYAWRKILTS